ncbi:MAG TPA: DinB family protein [Streptosporangiaceae bacterium]|nr:DinB family protein [Streptosporangiaceae bacterium]
MIEIPEAVEFFEPSTPAGSTSEVFLNYLNYFRSKLVAKVRLMPEADQRASRLPSGWTPLELIKHLRFMERRWLVWGFEGQAIPDPWADRVGDRWHVNDDETLDTLVAGLAEQAATTRSIVKAHDLSEVGQPSGRWAGKPPPTLDRILFHMMQEYARHVGHIDIVCELATGTEEE